MGIKAGLVGLPNVGKSTLFNALTKSSIPAENYPFCTIDPHLAITEVPDKRFNKLLEFYNSKKIVPATVSFVDIAGLVKGAASGEGLGNKFLSHIRGVDLIIHVLRCFEDSNIIHSQEVVDPLDDYEIIVSELMLKDLESIEKRLEKLDHLEKAAQSKPAEKKEIQAERELLKSIQTAFDSNNIQTVRKIISDSSTETVPLLSAKDFLIVANIAEDEIEDQAYKNNPGYQALAKKFGHERVIPLSAKVEHEIAQMNESDAQEIMSLLGLKERVIDTVIRKSYQHLGMITFFTCGPKEIHAWPIKTGSTVREAAGTIHSDLERGFICADVFNYNDLINTGTEAKLKELGKIRTEGQDYLTQDGDIILVKFNV